MIMINMVGSFLSAQILECNQQHCLVLDINKTPPAPCPPFVTNLILGKVI